jgi:hypothetical protein
LSPTQSRLQPRAPDLRSAWAVLSRNYLALWFLFADAWYVVPASAKAIAGFEPGSDAILYASAAHAWLSGMDPWQVAEQGVRFGGPPPTLLLFAPFAGLTPAVTAGFWLAADLVAVAFVIRRLHLTWWWVIFPPVLQAILPANPEPVVLAFLVAARPGIQGIAPILKIYALAPLLGERRWRAICIALILLLATVVILPWGLFIADLPLVSETLALQGTGLSALSVPWLLPVGVIGLVSLGFRRAGWLAVPVLWPNSQIHYATTALPEMTPILAVGFSLPIAGAPPVAVAIQAGLERWRTRRGARSPTSDPGAPAGGRE